MSSLFGAITSGKKEITEEQMIKRNQIIRGLAVYSESSGEDSIGVGVANRNTFAFLKQVIGATEFLQTPKYKEFMLKYSPLIIQGHTKNLTMSEERSHEVVHPFIKGRIMGCHTGFVHDWEKIDSKAKVDSESIFTLLNKEKNDYKKVFADLEGSFGLTWTDSLCLDKVFIGKKEMPLFLSFVKELKTYFWCSSVEPFAFLYETIGVKQYHTWEVKRNTVYEIDTSLKTKKIDVTFKSTIADKVRYDNGSYHYDNYDNTETFWQKQEREEKETIENILYPKSFLNDFTKIQEKFKNGCSMCQLKIDIKGLGFYWNKEEEFIVCSNCTNLFTKNDWQLFDFITIAGLLHKTTQNKSLVTVL